MLLKSQSMKMGKGVRHVLRTCSHPVPSRYLAELCGVGTCGEPRAAFPTVSCAFLLLARQAPGKGVRLSSAAGRGFLLCTGQDVCQAPPLAVPRG